MPLTDCHRKLDSILMGLFATVETVATAKEFKPFFQSNSEDFRLLPCHLVVISNEPFPGHCQSMMPHSECVYLLKLTKKPFKQHISMTVFCKSNCRLFFFAFYGRGWKGTDGGFLV